MLTTQSPRRISMETKLRLLTTPRVALDSLLFAADGHVHPAVREQLLRFAQVIIDGCIIPFPWFEVKDIVICGVSASFNYHPFDNISLMIVAARREENSIFAYDYQAYNFIRKFIISFGRAGRKFYLQNRRVEIRISFRRDEPVQYSLLHCQWNAKPTCRPPEPTDDQQILQRAAKLEREIGCMCSEHLQKQNGKYALEDLMRLQKFYNCLVEMKTGSQGDSLIYKLLARAGCLRRIRNFYMQRFSETLSF